MNKVIVYKNTLGDTRTAERMPTKEEFVDVAIFEVTQRFETFNDWYEGQDEFEIVAWQPLPEPYEEAE